MDIISLIRSTLKLHIFSSENINHTVNYRLQVLVVLVLTSMLIWLQPELAHSGTICSIDQITDTTGAGNFSPSINADGTRIAFVSEQDLTGSNADGNFEIFLFDTNTSTFTQITDTTGGFNFSPSINADGTRIAFVSDRDLTGSNADGNEEIFLSECPFPTTPEPPSGPIVIIPTMGQMGLIIATMLLGFFAVIALRRRIKS